jgi:hypothetical protein
MFMGYIRYPLYLMHENMMIPFIIKFKSLAPVYLLFDLPLFVITITSITAYIVTKFLERPAKVFREYLFSLKNNIRAIS